MGEYEAAIAQLEALVASSGRTQRELARLLVDPSRGVPVTPHALQHWLNGRRAVPVWVLKRLRELQRPR